MFDWAKGAGHYPHENPVKGGKKALPLVKRQTNHLAAMDWRDLPGFMEDLAGREGVSARTLEFLILTAMRSNEARGACWSEIDLEAREWTIPGERMKRGIPHRVPLSEAAIAVLERARGLDPDSVFPSVKRGADGETRPQSVMVFKSLMKRMRRDGFTVHGFRSCFGMWCSESAHADREVAEAALSHAMGNEVERAYARSDLFEKKGIAHGKLRAIPIREYRRCSRVGAGLNEITEKKLNQAVSYAVDVASRYCANGKVYIPQFDPDLRSVEAAFLPVFKKVGYRDKEEFDGYQVVNSAAIIAAFESSPRAASAALDKIATTILFRREVHPDLRGLVFELLKGKREAPSPRRARPSLQHRNTLLVGIAKRISDQYGLSGGANPAAFKSGNTASLCGATIAGAALTAFRVSITPRRCSKIYYENSKLVSEDNLNSAFFERSDRFTHGNSARWTG